MRQLRRVPRRLQKGARVSDIYAAQVVLLTVIVPSRQYCTQMVGTYNGRFNKEGPAKGDKSYGGYANYNR